MGLSDYIFGKKKRDKLDAEVDEPIWDPAYMYYDNFGVLRVGREERNRDEELEDIKELEDKKEVEGKVWYIIESSWVRQWLRYTNTSRNTPCPGPIKNERLLRFHVTSAENMENNKWIIQENLVQANSIEGREGEGHYRRVNEAVWNKFAELYPGSGPVITVSEAPYDDKKNWNLDLDSIKKIDRIGKAEDDFVKLFRKQQNLTKAALRNSIAVTIGFDTEGGESDDHKEKNENQENNEGENINIEDIYTEMGTKSKTNTENVMINMKDEKDKKVSLLATSEGVEKDKDFERPRASSQNLV